MVQLSEVGSINVYLEVGKQKRGCMHIWRNSERDFSLGIGSLQNLSCAIYKINFFFPLMVDAQRLYLSLNEEKPILVH